MGFAEVLKEQLESALGPTHYEARGHLKLTKMGSFRNLIESQAPNYVILQVGHFELTGGMSLPRSARNAVLADLTISENPEPSRFLNLWSRFYWRIRSIVKLAREFVAPKLVVDFEQFSRQLSEAMHGIGDSKSKIILLSPLPCADPSVMRLRLKALPYYRDAAASVQCTFLDVTSDAILTRSGLVPYYDAIHLSAEGHRRIGLLLSDVIEQLEKKDPTTAEGTKSLVECAGPEPRLGSLNPNGFGQTTNVKT